MKTDDKFHHGGTVTGRFLRGPEPHEFRQRREPISQVIVHMDFAQIEERVMAQLEAKGDLAEAMRKALVSRKQSGHKI